MTQQINLFSPALRPKREVPRLALALAGIATVAAAAMGFYSHVNTQLVATREQRARADATLKGLQDQLTRIKPGAARAASQALETSVARAEFEVKSGDELLARLTGGGLGNTSGFSDYMVALARQRQDGVWITGLKVSGDGTQVTIRGGALNADLLPEYIRRLSREEALKGKPIADMRVQRKEIEVKDAASKAPAKDGAAGTQRLSFVEFAIGTVPGSAAAQGG